MPAELLAGETLPLVPGGKVAREIVAHGSGQIDTLTPGSMVGDWLIDGKIGQGGMGSVYAATHPVIGKRAAIKIVHAELCRSAGTVERFVQEARVVNQICHPSIVDIFDLGQLPDGRPYLVMELLRGCTLGERLAEERLSAVEGIEVLIQVADAVAAAHVHGVFHRDLKPDNIYLTDGPRGSLVKVVDWGIAKLRDVTPQSVALTTSGMVLGTPRYVSPEQARGKELDDRTDVYSLGVIAYEVFLEGPPFVADNVAEMLAMHLREPPPPPSEVWPDIPAQLERLLLAMLAKSAADRPSLADVVTALREARVELEAIAARRSARRVAVGSLPPPLGATGDTGATGDVPAVARPATANPTIQRPV
ncbi:MAG TPA: serine/threonine-protein kinase, partial [Kofleriaceae bacterium]|nr:serine/threonine-protein kinase [Kofleriaceae bacterium]